MPQITITEAISFVTAIGAVLLAWSTRRKTNAETSDLEDQITERVLKRAQTDMDRMQQQVDEVRVENRLLRAWVKLLCDQVVSLGGVPVPMPDKEK
jgi:hypothetical protein